MVASLALHSLFVLATSTFPYFHHGQQHETGEGSRQVAMVNVSQLPDETQSKESGSLPPMVIYNPKAVLGTETQNTNPNKKSDRDRLLDSIISTNYSLEEKLRDVILAGKSPNELYTHTNSAGEKDTIDYTEFFLVYLKKYFELKLVSSLVEPWNVQANKIDLRISFLATIMEDGQISIQYKQVSDLKKPEQEIFNYVINQFKRLHKFIPPSKANLKAPYQLEFTYFLSYKTSLKEVGLPNRKFKWIPLDR